MGHIEAGIHFSGEHLGHLGHFLMHAGHQMSLGLFPGWLMWAIVVSAALALTVRTDDS